MSEKGLLLSLPFLLSKKKNDKLRPPILGAMKMQKVTVKVQTTAGASKLLFNGYKFPRRTLIHAIAIYCDAEENAGFMISYYAYNPSRTLAGLTRKAYAKGSTLYTAEPFIIEVGETFTMTFTDAKAISNVQCELYYEVLK